MERDRVPAADGGQTRRILIADELHPASMAAEEEPPRYDVFICHASEDKDAIVDPLADELETWGLDVWYDRFQLEIGDSLTGSIDEGLSSSKFGVVVLSEHFFGKEWTEHELNGLRQRQVREEGPVILPLLYGISPDAVYDYSPTLADVYAEEVTEENILEVANKIRTKVGSNSSGASDGSEGSTTPFTTVEFRFQGPLNVEKGDQLTVETWRNHNAPKKDKLEAVTVKDGAGTLHESNTKGTMMTKKTIEDRPLAGRVFGVSSRSAKKTVFEMRIADEQLEELPDDRGAYRSL